MPGTLVSDTNAPILVNETVTADDAGFIADVEVGYPGLVAIKVDIGAVSGTTPTLTLQFRGSNDGTTYYDLAAMLIVEADASTTKWIRGLNVPYRYMEVVGDVGGTTPSFAIVAKVHEHMYMQTLAQE